MLKLMVSFFLLLAGGMRADALSQEDYLSQVRLGNSMFKAQQSTDVALQLAMLEPGTKLSPKLDANASYLDDQSLSASPFATSRIVETNWDAELSKQFAVTGTHLTLGYKGMDSSTAYPSALFGLFGSIPGLDLSNPIYFDNSGYYVSVEQPLWKDFGARGYDVAQRETDANVGEERLMNRYSAASMLFKADSAYLQLASDREIMDLLEDSLQRNQKILELTQSKFNDNLVDKVDVLQADAALKQVQLGIDETRQQMRQDEEEFNTLRGVSPGAEVTETLGPVEAPASFPERQGERLDIQAARKDEMGKEAMAEEIKERYRPDLSIFGTATASGAGETMGDAAAPDKPTYLVGIKLDTILDVALYDKVVAGAEKTINLTKDDLRQKQLQEEEDWEALSSQWTSLQDSLQLAEALEAVQEEKAEREKTRYENGQTTNFQVLRFEDDYIQARIGTLRLKTQAAILASQANFYNGGGIQW